LRAEGAARELVRAVNDERKAQGLAISDRIALVVCAAADVLAAVDAHRGTVAGEVLATEVEVRTGDSTTMARAVTTSIGSIGFSVEAR
jgi:isoleucyl-tRNA synthetase